MECIRATLIMATISRRWLHVLKMDNLDAVSEIGLLIAVEIRNCATNAEYQPSRTSGYVGTDRKDKDE